MPEPIIADAATARPLNIVGEHLKILASGSQTGSYEIFHQAGPEGSGPPPHSHPWDEAFYVIRGDIAFGIEEKEMVAKPGTLVHLPAGTTHWFRFLAGGGEMVSMTSREGASHFFTELDREVAPDNPDISKLVEIGQKHGLSLGQPPA